MMTILETWQPTGLQILWFLLIAVLWIGFFFLEGFDFGVAMLYPTAWKKPDERRVMINSIGPSWDGNEVWLLTAGGATFAAFPGWYATLFSGLYLPLLLVLLGLIVRGVAFEYRALYPDDRWRNTFDAASTIGSFIVALVLGVGFANFVKGMPVNAQHMFTGSFWSLFSPFALLGGVLFVVLFVVHGSMFLSLKTSGTVRENSRKIATNGSVLAAILLVAFVVSQNVFYPASANVFLPSWGGIAAWVLGAVAIVGMLVSIAATRAGRDGWAFIGTGLAILGLIAGIFVKIYGTLGFISADAAHPLNIVTAASSPLTLGLMRIIAFVMVPIVLVYQAWSYWIFRRRLDVSQIPVTDQKSDKLTTASV